MEADPKTLGVAGVIALTLLGLLSWLVKKGFALARTVVMGFLDQNKKMVDGALTNMKANTEAINANVAAIGANTEATLRHISACDVRAQLAAKDVELVTKQAEARQKQLDKIESDVHRIRLRGAGGKGDT